MLPSLKTCSSSSWHAIKTFMSIILPGTCSRGSTEEGWWSLSTFPFIWIYLCTRVCGASIFSNTYYCALDHLNYQHLEADEVLHSVQCKYSPSVCVQYTLYVCFCLCHCQTWNPMWLLGHSFLTGCSALTSFISTYPVRQKACLCCTIVTLDWLQPSNIY